jgi:hypothetical protein
MNEVLFSSKHEAYSYSFVIVIINQSQNMFLELRSDPYFLPAEERKRQKMFSHALLGTGSRVGSRSSEPLFCLPRASLTCVYCIWIYMELRQKKCGFPISSCKNLGRVGRF